MLSCQLIQNRNVNYFWYLAFATLITLNTCHDTEHQLYFLVYTYLFDNLYYSPPESIIAHTLKRAQIILFN